MLDGSKKPRMRSTMLARFAAGHRDFIAVGHIHEDFTARSPGASASCLTDTGAGKSPVAEITCSGRPSAHLQQIAARVRGVQQTQANPAARDFDIRTLRAVDQQRVANKATAARLAVFRCAKVIQTLSG